jgi:hypothetical protein
MLDAKPVVKVGPQSPQVVGLQAIRLNAWHKYQVARIDLQLVEPG